MKEDVIKHLKKGVAFFQSLLYYVKNERQNVKLNTSAFSRKPFDILVLPAEAGRRLPHRQIKEKSGYSFGTANQVVPGPSALHFLSGGEIANEGMPVPEPYPAKWLCSL